MNKKAYFFIIDAILALLVLTVGITLVLTLSYREPASTQSEFLSVDLMKPLDEKIRGGIPRTKLCGSGGTYEELGLINPENTVLTQIAEFYYRDALGDPDALEYAEQCAEDALPMANIKQYNFEIVVEDTSIYQNATVNRDNESVRVKIPSRRVVFGFYNDTFFGPYMAEVWVWQ